MKITPLDIKQQQFRKVRGRYDAGEVDSFMNMVALEMEELLREHDRVKEDLKRTKARLDELVENERILRDAIVSTQKSAEVILDNARQNREVIIAEAKLDAETLVRNAHEQVKKMNEDIVEMRRQRARVESELSAILNGHLKMLDATSEQADRNDREADKVAILSKK
jgi:cell division initiation protein